MMTARTITIRTALDAGGPATYREVNPPSDTTRFIRAVIPLTSLRVEEMAMCEALAHVRSGAVSETPDEAAFVCSIDEQYDSLRAFVAQSGTDFSQFTFEVCDGHHRIAAAMLDGHTHVVVDIDTVPDDEPMTAPFFDFATTCPHTGSKPCNTCDTCHYNTCPVMFGGTPERPDCTHNTHLPTA